MPGVQDGLAQLEKQTGHPMTQPPIVMRAHATDIDDVMTGGRSRCIRTIDTMLKWNGESLTWTNVRGPVKDALREACRGVECAPLPICICSRIWSRFAGAIRILFGRR